MCVQVKASEFRNDVIKIARGKDHNTIFEYLRTTGMIVNERGGVLSIEEDCLKKIEFFTSEVQVGDIVWNSMHGLRLVIDKRPAANNDGHHFRALKVVPDDDGSYKIVGDERSVIIDDAQSFRLRPTTFDIETIDQLSYQRYLAYVQIAKLSEQISSMKEQPNGNDN